MGRPKGSKNKPKVVPAPPPAEPQAEDETPRGGGKCGWCSTKQHDQCRPKLDSQPKWTCSCYENDHGTVIAKTRTKRKV